MKSIGSRTRYFTAVLDSATYLPPGPVGVVMQAGHEVSAKDRLELTYRHESSALAETCLDR